MKYLTYIVFKYFYCHAGATVDIEAHRLETTPKDEFFVIEVSVKHWRQGAKNVAHKPGELLMKNYYFTRLLYKTEINFYCTWIDSLKMLWYSSKKK